MQRSSSSKILYPLLFIVIAFGAFHFRVEIKELILHNKPCSKPIKYALGTIDKRFGVSDTTIFDNINSVNKIWSDTYNNMTGKNKNLFEYSREEPDLFVNLVYDYRQETTQKLESLGVVIDENKNGYELLKAKYEALKSKYESAKTLFETHVSNFEAEKKAYEDKVAYWNSHGGAPKEEYQSLKTTLAKINALAENLKVEQTNLNSISSTLNEAVSALNKLAQNVNMNVKDYNNLGKSVGEEFNEGEYIEDNSGTRINIYEFSNDLKLKRVLAHEFGHALGLGHVEDKRAIMYRLNESTNDIPTETDRNELKRVCQLK